MNVNISLSPSNNSVRFIEINSKEEWDSFEEVHGFLPYNYPRDLVFPFMMICNMNIAIMDKIVASYLSKDEYEILDESYYIQRSDGMYYKERGEMRSSKAFSRKFSKEEFNHAKEICEHLNMYEEIKDVAAQKNGEKPNGFDFKVVRSMEKKA